MEIIFKIDDNFNYITSSIKTRALTQRELYLIHDSILNTWSKQDIQQYINPIKTYNGHGKWVVEDVNTEYIKQTLLDLGINEVKFAILK